ncbi:voltage-gated chloride channel protein (ClC-type) [Legionella beliardensis]|uniref:Voltage-gated chloride channel protein (ClC-type) n=1 Tax=Legionella beliardensis TaxID=91822 RepID=A0A378I137_9GAMM|nr:chloride channel protein [Legionella beliardensis]STX28693.1 voltage-gated chloride channel protein (ClC-type) [Legionella beliardensis]
MVSDVVQKLTNFLNLKLFSLAALGGIAIGSAVSLIRTLVGFIQTILFGTNVNMHSAISTPWERILAVTTVGGLILGLLLVLSARYKRLSMVDPIEANAVNGGKMSFLDSLTFVGLSLVSISIGGSVGFEAAMTQLGAGTLSAIGQRLNFARQELRMLVSCGTGAGIAAIFGAPLAGAFYALELVVGGYATRALMPTLLASSLSSLMVYILIGYEPLFKANIVETPSIWHFPIAILIGCMAAAVGILVMRGTTSLEYLLKSLKLPNFLKPAIGGLFLGLIALIVPQVMGPGHYGINEILAGSKALHLIILILLAKMAASIACVGSGFRGGLFSASLFLGAALGCIIHDIITIPLFGHAIPLDLTVVAGMAGVAASIIGTPAAIILLLLETANLNLGVISTVITVIVSSVLTRYLFGYSFSTWRFHIRGSDITGPQDIGRLKALTFGNLPLIKLPTIAEHTSLIDAANAAKRAEVDYIAIKDKNGHFLGLANNKLLLTELEKTSPLSLCNLIEKNTHCVYQTESIVNYIDTINEKKLKRLSVIDENHHFIGLVSEVAILRRYLIEIVAAQEEELEHFPKLTP